MIVDAHFDVQEFPNVWNGAKRLNDWNIWNGLFPLVTEPSG